MVATASTPHAQPSPGPGVGTRRPSGSGGDPGVLTGDDIDFLLRHAILAPSSHNTQPWIFEVHDARIDVHADLTRWLEVADADRRELHVSLGCAIENLVLAGEYLGLAPTVLLFPDAARPDHVATLRFPGRASEDRPSRPVELLEVVAARHTERRAFDSRPIPERVRSELGALAVESGVRIQFIDLPSLRQNIEDLTVRADQIQYDDRSWRRELAHWIGEGVFGTGWLMSRIGRFAVRHFDLGRSVSETDRERLASAPLLGIVTTASSSPADRVRAGQVFQRLFLAATRAGLGLHPMNQVLQVPRVRDELVALLPGEWGTPQMVFRLGYAEVDRSRRPSPRRPLAEVVRRRGEGM